MKTSALTFVVALALVAGASAAKVKVATYTEDHVELMEVPYGNAQGTGSNVQCQHGPDECKGNRYECCAIQEYPNATQWYPFVYCMENYGDSMLNHVQDCATQASLSYQKIENCYQGPAGDKCVTKAAQTTNNLQPPHEYTPWVTVNGRHLAGAQHLISVVCKEIKSADKPDICAQSNDDDDGMWTDDGNTFEPCMREW